MYVQYPGGTVPPNAVYARGNQQFGGGLTQPLPVYAPPRDTSNAFIPGPGSAHRGQFAPPSYSGPGSAPSGQFAPPSYGGGQYGQHPAYDGFFSGSQAPQGNLDAYAPQPQDFCRGAPPRSALPQQQPPFCGGPGGRSGAYANGSGSVGPPPHAQTPWQPPPQACGPSPPPPAQQQAQPAHGPFPGQPGQPPAGNVEEPEEDPNRLPTFVKVRGLPPDNDPRIARRPKAKKRAPGVCCG